ncbi:MAG: tRNA (adenosine(37)-N6)-dimethylallyltransferase MiaA [Clostridiales bacterium]|jgi:tRNA dimethylallyltransferase|nr:tRNA (adenosine(37)-N6)-dimethylallyltransferase MiaA [Clostridiales bacterium]
MDKLLAIVGPTAVGKSHVALSLAKCLGGEIVSADSVQVYRGMDIGAAKPTPKERAEVPHHLIDIVEPDVYYTVADFQRDALAVIHQIHSRGKLPILVGGTGLYTRAVIQEFTFSESGMNEIMRERLWEEAEKKGPAHLHAKLVTVDPVTAKKIHPNDLRRVIRALEVFEQSNCSISEQAAKTSGESRYDTAMFALTMPREKLYQRIEERVDKMMAQGLLEEVEGLLKKGVSADAKSMQSLGYRQLVACLQGDLTLEEAVSLIKRDTRRFAKRQLTWLRREQEITWVDCSNFDGIAAAAENIYFQLAGKY